MVSMPVLPPARPNVQFPVLLIVPRTNTVPVPPLDPTPVKPTLDTTTPVPTVKLPVPVLPTVKNDDNVIVEPAPLTVALPLLFAPLFPKAR